ncbi:MAG: Holliday junction resolvase RuvX [Nitrospira sp.]|nr:Holliday junction resolvase RuvX [Nitrospira sp.]
MRGRILALDYGTKRIGVALSDELWWTAQPFETFERRTLQQDVLHIASLVASYDVKRVVVGLPLQLDGRAGPAARSMREFVVQLEASLSVPLVLWDERMTTKAAEEFLIAADVSRKKRKTAVDRIAASLLLQSYLASLTAPAQGDSEDSGFKTWEGCSDSHAERFDEVSHEASFHTTLPPPRRRFRPRRGGSVSGNSMG